MTRSCLRAALFWVATAAIVPAPSSAQRSDTKRENLTRGNAADAPQAPKNGDRMGVFVELRDDKTPREIAGLGLRWVRIMETMHKMLAQIGARDKHFWITEYGVPTGGPFGAVTPDESGVIYRHYFQAFNRLEARGVPIGPTFFWTLHDSLSYQKANAIEGWEGVYDSTGKAKASVALIKARAARAQ
jgi:hypothetical protein